jgi:pimeloyl-ACP methyl ester carboxylesterase
MCSKRSNMMAQTKPIIFIHGLFQGPFRPGVSQFLAPNLVSIPDLPGYGTNRPASPDGISVSAAADFIYAHIHELGYEQAHLVGHSVGGAVAVVVASRYPEAVASIVSVEGNFTLKDAFWSQQLARMDRNQTEAVLESYRADPRAWLAGSGIDATEEQIELAVHSLAAQPSSTLQAMASSVVQTTSDASYLQGIATILDQSIPFHLVAGSRSRDGWDVPAWVLQRATSVTIQPDAGHMMMLEDQQNFLSIIRQLIPA